MCGISVRENREIPWPPDADGAAGRIGKARGHKPMMNDQGKSDRPMVLTKLPNKAGQPAAEAVEGRGLTKGNPDKLNASRTQRRVIAQSALDRVRQVARKDKKARFTALFHHLTVDRLRAAFFGMNRGAAPGSDGVTWLQYEADLESHLQDLHRRLQRGAVRKSRPYRDLHAKSPSGGPGG